MHASNKQWLIDLKKTYPKSFRGKKVLELGSGSTGELTVRSFFENCAYVGVDRVGKEGGNNGVDIVADAADTSFKKNSFDILVILSMFEHDPEWRQSLVHNLQWLKPDGMIFTCFGAEGNNHHGPEPWALVPYREFMDYCATLPITILDAFFEEFRYGPDCPGAFDVVAVKKESSKKFPIDSIVVPEPQTQRRDIFRLLTTISLSTKAYMTMLFVFAFTLAYIKLYPPIINAMVFSLCTVLGYAGLRLSPKIFIPELVDFRISHVNRCIQPALIGAIWGSIFFAMSVLTHIFVPLSSLQSPSLGLYIASILAYTIGAEIITRLFFIPFAVLIWDYSYWKASLVSLLLSFVIQIVWVSTIGVHLTMGVFGIILFTSGMTSLLSAYYLKRYGFFASLSFTFASLFLWHIVL